MQVTKELIDSEVQGAMNNLKAAEASVAKLAGALEVLKNIQAYLDKPEPVPEPAISDTNSAIQAKVEAEQAPPTQPLVANAQGKYEVQNATG